MSFGDEADDGIALPPPTPHSDLADKLAELVDRACHMFRDTARQCCPVIHDANELARLATEIQTAVRQQGIRELTGASASALVTVDDPGAQRVMAERHNARADAADADEEVQKWSAA